MDDQGVCAPWPELPPELAGIIFGRLRSYSDRVRFRAVCRAWRLAARHQHPLPPVLPWLRLDRTTFQSLPDGEVHRLPVPSELPPGTVCRGAFDGWLLYESGEQRERSLRNPITKAKIDLPYHCDVVINPDFYNDGLYTTTVSLHEAVLRKIVVCSPDFVAAIIDYGDVLFHRPGMHSTWSLMAACPGFVHDIALYRGKLYLVTGHGELAVHDFTSTPQHSSRHGSSADQDSCVDTVIDTAPPLNKQSLPERHFWDCIFYLVVSCTGELLMVRWRWCLPGVIHFRRRCAGELSKGIEVDVFEADLEKRRWSEVKELGEQALFLGTTCSKALPLPDHANCVFFLGLNVTRFSPDGTVGGIGDCAYCVHDMRNGTFSFDNLASIKRDFERSRDDWFFPYDGIET